MTKIVKKVEVRVPNQSSEDPLDRKSQIVYFPWKPDDFYLEDQTQKVFIQTMDLENSRQHILKYSPVLISEMD